MNRKIVEPDRVNSENHDYFSYCNEEQNSAHGNKEADKTQ